MKLYELVGRDKSNSFSPFVWRAKLALAHKGFEYETVPLHFTEIKETLSFADAKTVPILVDGDKVTTDSWEICTYLEDTYPERPSLFQSRSAARLFTFQLSMPLLVPLFRTIVADIYDVIDDSDKDFTALFYGREGQARKNCWKTMIPLSAGSLVWTDFLMDWANG